MKRVGIITYHSAYNYGSVLQALATQKIIESLGYSATILNYRMDEQRKFYSMYRTQYGIKCLLKDIMQAPVHNKRRVRVNKFENFMQSYMKLTKEASVPGEIEEIWNGFDVIVSGSDQIWNKHSCEMENNDWFYMNPYLLIGYKGKKVSYASSIANMTNNELQHILPNIKEFNHISMREKCSAEKMSQLLNREIDNVLDPTFLLSKQDWIRVLDLNQSNEEDFILYYSLGGIKPLKHNLKILKIMAQKYNCKVKIITPFAYISLFDEKIKIHPEVGPKEFLYSIYNARAVITDSYHGTILSINFEKDIYSICGKGGSEFRKSDILEQLGLEDRIVYNIDDLGNKNYLPINYDSVINKLSELRNRSINYIKKSIG